MLAQWYEDYVLRKTTQELKKISKSIYEASQCRKDLESTLSTLKTEEDKNLIRMINKTIYYINNKQCDKAKNELHEYLVKHCYNNDLEN